MYVHLVGRDLYDKINRRGLKYLKLRRDSLVEFVC